MTGTVLRADTAAALERNRAELILQTARLRMVDQALTQLYGRLQRALRGPK